ncbi:phospholipase D family protein [Pseudomonas hefeiensis]|uniref:Phospholipase D family protein n=1 Tax=Pseudomonas hefeiensis TaxID=2738125 RepID=A0ABY9GGW8_9PSED|nr:MULTISPECIES: phospholipase D family protein [unclassified Pseudomonas]WLH14857.1 phospholipase D family protein [Pseudomonas sp. FP205]WLH97908.1 phospholipase D family protein [Pseudomonas sp. FP53]WLI42183.1 phospholipase D family protein [Pseudomonas sp. FP821]
MLKIWFLIMMMGWLSACTPLPSLEGRNVSEALLSQDGADTQLGRGLAPQVERHPGLSGVASLSDPLGAFAARMVLITAAQRTIDVQYYIWRDDTTGNLMLHALHEAAKRKVRVRMLIDDNGTSGLDEKLALLNAQENVEVRLFNPFPQRRFKSMGFLTDFGRLNRRMHNKSLTVDGQVTVVGGRNIGDEYFGATQGIAFADLDVLVAGTVVDDVSKDFDRYWNSPSAYPVETLVALPDGQRSEQLHEEESASAIGSRAKAYVDVITQSQFVEDLTRGQMALQWVPVRMVSDDPGKVLDEAPPQTLLLSRLTELLGRPAESIDLISPYFVPTKHGVEAFGALADEGVRLRILTNAMESTDVLAVHAGYAKSRAPLLKKSIELFEMRHQSAPDAPKEKAGPFGSSGASLHAKTFAVDGKRVFVGSFNFDPRSARLNTELGFVIDSEPMARAIAKAFDDAIFDHAYQLELDEDDKIVWLERSPQGVKRLSEEPSTSLWRRLYLRLLWWLPLEPLL